MEQTNSNTKAKITFYPVGNGDTTQIETANNKRIIIDFNRKEPEKEGGFDLSEELKKSLGNKEEVDVFMATHMDDDHIGGFSEFFELQHAEKYQGEDRIKIKELWVPAAVILETGEEISGEKAILRAEARYRLEQKTGIKIFSKPEDLKDYLEEHNITGVDHLFVSAGQKIKDFEGLEIFCHTPFYDETNEDDIKRNECSIITHYTFIIDGIKTKYFHIGDTEYQNIERLVKKSDDATLEWDILNIPHHCSYKALSPDKVDKKWREGQEKKTVPTENVAKLLKKGRPSAYMISSSNPIENEESDQPPHIEAKRCYEEYLDKINGTKFLVTMEYPNKKEPKPIVLELSNKGIKLITKTLPTIPSNPAVVHGVGGNRYA
jgi:beta-lactamase superfamily II metal-dependent hydrolase